ncbi:DUF6879 family protein [Dactylosporangium sp. NPDC005555]|uniref:DUF6879 family protein n=1 Tax=Dactylosporangium sp. NPDC005555 TaxID=3154889 RepID=UPI0033BD548F
MTELINDPDAFPRIFASVQSSAFKLEVRRGYGVASEDDAFQAFLKGDDPGVEWHQPWLDLMRETTGKGICVERIRVVDEPPSDFLRFEISMTPYNVEAGEDVRYLSRSVAQDIGLPSVDYWLFDSNRLYILHFADDDQFLGLEEITDEAVTATFIEYRDRAWKHTAPFQQ